MSGYYINFIDPGNSGGSVPTPDTRALFASPDRVFSCRYCEASFSSEEQRIHHEWDEHPSKNPQLYIFQRSVGSGTISIRSRLCERDIDLLHYEKIFVNGIEISYENAISLILSKDKYFFELSVINKGVKKDFKIDVDISDPNELSRVDELFDLFLCRGDVTGSTVDQFVDSCSDLRTAESYVDGIVKYLQGVMSKDGKTKILTFEDFEAKFNQSRAQLKVYSTPLASAIQAVIDFNQNKFDSSYVQVLPNLKNAVAFFKGGILESLSNNMIGKVGKVPVDRVTSHLIDDILLMYDKHTVDSIKEEILILPRRNISLNDRKKFDYLLLRKACNDNRRDLMDKMKKRLSHDDVFSVANLEEL